MRSSTGQYSLSPADPQARPRQAAAPASASARSPAPGEAPATQLPWPATRRRALGRPWPAPCGRSGRCRGGAGPCGPRAAGPACSAGWTSARSGREARGTVAAAAAARRRCCCRWGRCRWGRARRTTDPVQHPCLPPSPARCRGQAQEQGAGAGQRSYHDTKIMIFTKNGAFTRGCPTKRTSEAELGTSPGQPPGYRLIR